MLGVHGGRLDLPIAADSSPVLRRADTRSSEEIDAVGMVRGRVTVIGEARWRSHRIDLSYMREVEQYKLPALRQSKLKVAAQVRIVLACLGGYGEALTAAAAERKDVILVDVPQALAGQSS